MTQVSSHVRVLIMHPGRIRNNGEFVSLSTGLSVVASRFGRQFLVMGSLWHSVGLSAFQGPCRAQVRPPFLCLVWRLELG